MVKTLLIALLALLLLPNAAPAAVTWKSDLATGKVVSLKSGKPLLVFFHASWCGPCHMMEDETFTNTTVQSVLQKFVCVRLDIDQHVAEAQAFGVNSIPRIMLMPPGGGSPLMDTTGYMAAPDFLDALGQALHTKLAGGGAAIVAEDKNLTAIKQALAGNTYAAFKQKDPKAAAAGLNLLVNQLGVYTESEVAPLVALLGAAGDDAIPALIRGMGSKTLAVRAGNYRSLTTILKTRAIPIRYTFDPWETASRRQQRVQQWDTWWKHRS